MSVRTLVLTSAIIAVAACGGGSGSESDHAARRTPTADPGGERLVVAESLVVGVLEASGIAEPVMQATLSTKLMGTVTAVLVKEGDAVRRGQALVRIDARDLAARRVQVESGIAGAEAAQREAALHAGRMRALFADSAAPRAQVDAAEAGLARADAALSAARAGNQELAAVADYSVIRAPFAGVVTQRFVDAGAFAAPGAPLLTVQDHRQLRVAVTVPPTAARSLVRGSTIALSIEGIATHGRVEAAIPSPSNGLYIVNALVDNPRARFASGGAASLRVPQAERKALLVPLRAIRREGDLTGLTVEGSGGTTTRWVRLGSVIGDRVEVLSGLRPGETIRIGATAVKE